MIGTPWSRAWCLAVGPAATRWALHSMRKIAAALALVASLVGCDAQQHAAATTAPAGSSVSIIGISPTTDVVLHIGQHVRLEVRVAYSLSVEPGRLELVVQDDESPVAMNRVNVAKGSGNEEFVAELQVPQSKRLQVFVHLSAAGQTTTTTVAFREYKIAPR